jgi:hypothetical protein
VKFLVTGMAEYYLHVEAENSEEALKKASIATKAWRRSTGEPLKDVQVVELDAVQIFLSEEVR